MQYFDNRGMKYWDDFELRARETIDCIKGGTLPPMRRLSMHITNGCNFGCEYCNEAHFPRSIDFATFSKIMREYSEMGGGIVHVTGGEPTVVKDFAGYIEEAGKYTNISFHVNTNLYSRVITDDLFPVIKRLKVSLDTHSAAYFNGIVRRKQAFERVTENLDRVHDLIVAGKTDTIVSLTYTTTRENYQEIPDFLEMYSTRWPKFYATFFSSYKGTNPRFVLTEDDTERLFTKIVPMMDEITNRYGDTETRHLFHASHEPRTFKTEDRFPEVRSVPCWLQLSEFVVNEDGDIWNCSHLFRDKVPSTGLNVRDGHLRDLFSKAKESITTYPLSDMCAYGCNKKLTRFNDVIQANISK